jgi:hypothetical protein
MAVGRDPKGAGPFPEGRGPVGRGRWLPPLAPGPRPALPEGMAVGAAEMSEAGRGTAEPET